MNVWHAELMPCFTIPVCIIIIPTSERSQIAGGNYGEARDAGLVLFETFFASQNPSVDATHFTEIRT